MILAIFLASLLTACGVNSAFPNTQIVRKAIALQVAQTQQKLSQQLRSDLGSAKVEVDRVRITNQKPLTIQNLTAYRIEGTYDVALKLPKRKVTQKNNPFEVYLQRQPESKNWRIAQRQKEGAGWVTQLVE
jgi:hypothetical protein